jgi:signal transduction histidine kinase/AmiR/NasT family two-component response regulator
MIVEDESVVALDLKEALMGFGYEVVAIASSGAEAVVQAMGTRPDLIFMDIRLGPGMDGVQAAEEIRKQLDVPIIYLSAYTDEETLDKARRTGPFGYLVKPYSEPELRTTVEMALYKHAMEVQLAEREKWLSTTLRSIGDGVIATQADGKVLFMNPVAQKLTHWPEEEALGQDLSRVFRLVSPAGAGPDGASGPVHDPVLAVMASHRAEEITGEAWMAARDGHLLPVEDSAAPILGPKGEINGVVLVFRDASGRKAAEKAVRESEERLLHAQKLESLGRLAGGIAHDFNNMLAAINGYSDLILSAMKEGDTLRDHVLEIRRAGERAATLTNRLLAYSRKQVLQPRLVDLDKAVESMAEMLRRLIAPGITLVTRLGHDMDPVKVDPGQLEQAIMNLVVNAKDAMPKGGRITMETGRIRVEEHDRAHPTDADFCAVPGEYASLLVADEGVGMDEATRLRVFEPFFTTKSEGRGTGLGLSMVYGFVKQSGGCITVTSRPSEGATFRILFPMVKSGDGEGNPAAG